MITEDDRFGDKPFIYAKIYEGPPLIVLSDTGSGGRPGSGSSSPDTLRSFIETHPVPDNDDRPLNPRLENGEPCRKYLIICTHCHYDHVLGIPDFDDTSSVIIASKHGKRFIEEDFAEHSLCNYVGVHAPKYKVNHWATDMEELTFKNKSIHLQILHTPGHTPDELAWYDDAARHLFVGDSFYNRHAEDMTYEQAILFPPHGDLIAYAQSLEKMQSFVKGKNSEQGRATVKVGCGHTTSSVDGESTLLLVHKYFWSVLEGTVPVRKTTEQGGFVCDLFKEDGDPRFSLQVPRVLVDRAREHFKVGPPAAWKCVLL